MKIYVLIDDCPPEFGDVEVLEVFLNHTVARRELRKRKKEDSYTNQYYTLKTMIPFEAKVK